MPESPPRLVPDMPLPPYAFVPGQWPHPFSDPRGHRYGMELAPPEPFASDRWRESIPYLLGHDLFRYGYYWEAHEMWERLWIAHGRTGLTADCLKGLIHWAAAGVKVRQGQLAGVRSHTRRAAELFWLTANRVGPTHSDFLGLHLSEWRAAALTVAEQPPDCPDSEAPAVVVFDFLPLSE